MLGTERLPSELKPDKYNLMGVEKTAVKFVCGKPGVEERRSETVSLKLAWTLGPENGGAFFRKKQQHLFNQRYTWERTSAESGSKNVPTLEDYMPVPDTATPQLQQPQQVAEANVPPASAGHIHGDVVDAAGARALARNMSDCSEPEIEMLGSSLSLASAKKDSADRDEPGAKRPRYSKHGFEMGSSEMDLENLIGDKKLVVLELLQNMITHETRTAALPQRVCNTTSAELKTLKTKAVATKNKDLAQDATTLALQWSIMDGFLKSIRDYGFELKAPRRPKAPNFVNKYVEAKASCGDLFTRSLAPDVFSAYQVEVAMLQIEDRKYDFSQVDLLSGESLQAPMGSWDEDVLKAHQSTVAVKVWDRAIFNSENSSAGSDRYIAMEKWLSFLCIRCGPGDEINGSMLCPVLGRSTLHIWRIVIARLCLFRSSVSVSLVGASFARYCACWLAACMLVCMLACALTCMLACMSACTWVAQQPLLLCCPLACCLACPLACWLLSCCPLACCFSCMCPMRVRQCL